MKVKDLQQKRNLNAVLLILLLSVVGMTKMQAQNIIFADANVKALCVANWDTNNDDELSQAEAAVVTSLDGVFMFDDEITTFDELSFFTGLTSIGEDEFNSCTNLTAISIPNAVTSIGNYAFSDCASLASITTYACMPPTLGSNVFDNVPSAVVVNVPCHTSAMYQTASGWSDFSNYVEFEYGLCPIPFVDDNVKAICVAHWDTNGDGELSYAEAAAVTNLGTNFKSTAITSFDELENFTSLASIPNTAFYGCTSLASIALPSSVSALGNGSFYNCTNLATMTIYAETPPTVGTNAFKNVPSDMVVHVPCGAYEAYHTANCWSEFTIVQQSGSCPIVFADAYVKSLCVANWDTNGDGELSYDEAAAVTDLGQVFKNNSIIISFDELQYFMGLITIGNQAFYFCHRLTSIVIPNSVTSIGSAAFCYCSGLTSIEIPNTVTSIGSSAFGGCSNLTLIEIPNSVTSIGTYAFNNCSSLISIDIPNSVTSIESHAFQGCNGLTSIEIPNSVTLIGSNPFNSCSGLEQIIVDSGNSVYDSRDNCNAIIKTSTNELITGCKNTIIPNSTTSINCAFWSCRNLTSIEIPSSVTSIINEAFRGCTSLTAIEIPNSVTYIANRCFSGCSSLEQIVVDFGNSVYDSRENCNAIIKTSTNQLITGCKSTVIPSSVTSIENYAFEDCRDMTSLIIHADNPPTLGSYVFYNVSMGIPVYVPCENEEEYASIDWGGFSNFFGMCAGEITVAANPLEGGTVSGAGYYEGGATCTLTATANTGYSFINWTKNGTSVSNNASCSFIVAGNASCVANFVQGTLITFADAYVKALCVANWDIDNDGELSYAEAASVTDLGEVFRNNTNLISFNELQYFTGLTSIGTNAFRGCSGLVSVTIPNSVTTIGGEAFRSCSGLISIEIPSSVNSISSLVFYGCSSLEQIIVDSMNTMYDSRESCNAIIRTSTNKLVVGCKNTVIPNSVTSIGNYAFGYCTSLTSITIPNSITSIESGAFSSCTDLTLMIVHADNPPTLGSSVFYNVSMGIPVYVPCENEEEYASINWGGFSNFFGLCAGEITATANPIEGGTVSGAGYYEGGAICTLSATPNTGYAFVTWAKDGEVVSNSEIYSFYVTGDATFVANFIAIPPVPVVAEYYPEPNEPNSPYVKVHWAASSFEALIGEGTSTFGYFPFYTLYNYSIAENLFLANELMEAGVTSSQMTSLSWFATNAPGYEQQGISIWMANVIDTELTTTSHTVNNMTLVYTGSMTPQMGWNEFVFNEGTFVWDGVSNVLIFCQRNNGVWNSTVWWQSDDVGFTASSYRYQDSGPYNVNVANTMYTNTKRPNIIIKGEGGNSYNLYRSNCDGTGAQLIAENLSNTEYIDETWWQLENDSYKYGVSVADSTNTEIFWSNCIEKQGNVTVQTTTLSQGWNWFSTNLEITLDDLKAALVDAVPGTSISIKSRLQNTTYNPNTHRWSGSVAWDLSQMYRISVATDCEITLVGLPINPAEHPVTISNGVNWIAFPLSETLSLTDAFAGFAVNGDQIKSRLLNAQYRNNRWNGQFSTLVPGQGYIYISNTTYDRVFTFPDD